MQKFGAVMAYASPASAAYAQQQEHTMQAAQAVQVVQASQAAAEAAQRAQCEALYYETYLWPAVERVLASGTADAHALQQQLDDWNVLDQHPDLHKIKLSSAAGFFRAHPAYGVLSFGDWDKQHNPQPFREQRHAVLAQHA